MAEDGDGEVLLKLGGFRVIPCMKKSPRVSRKIAREKVK
jgi:hypothetical protein